MSNPNDQSLEEILAESRVAALRAQRAVNNYSRYLDENSDKPIPLMLHDELKAHNLRQGIADFQNICNEYHQLLHTQDGEIRTQLTQNEDALLEVLGYELEEIAAKIKRIHRTQPA